MTLKLICNFFDSGRKVERNRVFFCVFYQMYIIKRKGDYDTKVLVDI